MERDLQKEIDQIRAIFKDLVQISDKIARPIRNEFIGLRNANDDREILEKIHDILENLYLAAVIIENLKGFEFFDNATRFSLQAIGDFLHENKDVMEKPGYKELVGNLVDIHQMVKDKIEDTDKRFNNIKNKHEHE